MYMLRAVTNKDFPMLRQAMKATFNIELDYDPEFEPKGKFSLYKIFMNSLIPADPQGRIRIIFVSCEDLSGGWRRDTDVIGFNIAQKKLIFVAVPKTIEAIEPDCYYAPRTLEGYLIAITFHELYENITGDVHHCGHPGTCINSECQYHGNGTCSACMGGFIDKKFPDIALEDIYCEEHLSNLKRALAKNGY